MTSLLSSAFWRRLCLALAITCLSGLISGCKTASHQHEHKTTHALKTRNVILITVDGLRWQEVFGGVDDVLISDPALTTNPDRMKLVYGKPTPEEQRLSLMPFFWGELAMHGQIFGNQNRGSVSQVTNGKNFSYPGYNEILTGSPDARIDSNAGKPNANTNVLEWLNLQPAYRGKVAAVVNWNILPWILNTPRSQLPVWSGYITPPGAPVVRAPEIVENVTLDMTPIFSDMLFDAFTHHVALGKLEQDQPRVFYVAYTEPDEWAHEGRYDRYLVAANHTDRFIHDLWNLCQSLPQYRDQTTFIITADHGRGNGAEGWKSHDKDVAGSENTWIAIMGPDTPALGERTNCAPVTAGQVASTIAALLGEDLKKCNPNAAAPLAEVIDPHNVPHSAAGHEQH